MVYESGSDMWACIRPCTREDLPDVLDLDKVCMLSKVDAGWLADRFKSNPDLFYVAHDSRGSDEPIGYICGNYFVHKETGIEHGYISRLAVIPLYRRMGVGTMLLNALEYAFVSYREYRRCLVALRRENKQAFNFYKNNGYYPLPIYEYPRAYESGSDRIVMTKTLLHPDQYIFNTCVFTPSILMEIVPKTIIQHFRKPLEESNIPIYTPPPPPPKYKPFGPKRKKKKKVPEPESG